MLVLRQPGTLYTTMPDGQLANFYTLQAFNRVNRPVRFSIEVAEPRGATVMPLGTFAEVPPHGLLEGRFLLRVPEAAVSGTSTPLRLTVRTSEGVARIVTTSFLGPAKRIDD